MSELLSVSNLRVSFRLDKATTIEAVKGVSFTISAGEMATRGTGRSW